VNLRFAAAADQRPKLKCRVPGPGVDATFRIFDLYFDGDRPRLVLAWARDRQEPAQYVELDPAMLRQLGPSESLTFTYDGAVNFPPGFL
jgi:hypothetical protein